MAKTRTSFKRGNATGRPKGAINKSTRAVKEVFATVFSDLQDDPKHNLETWAKENITEFYKLVTRLIPTEIDSKFRGPTTIRIIRTPDA